MKYTLEQCIKFIEKSGYDLKESSTLIPTLEEQVQFYKNEIDFKYAYRNEVKKLEESIELLDRLKSSKYYISLKDEAIPIECFNSEQEISDFVYIHLMDEC